MAIFERYFNINYKLKLKLSQIFGAKSVDFNGNFLLLLNLVYGYHCGCTLYLIYFIVNCFYFSTILISNSKLNNIYDFNEINKYRN